MNPADELIIDAVAHPYNHSPENYLEPQTAEIICELAYGFNVSSPSPEYHGARHRSGRRSRRSVAMALQLRQRRPRPLRWRRDEMGDASLTALGEEIRGVLNEIRDPCSVSRSIPMGLDDMGLVKSVEVEASGRVEITLRLTSPFCEMFPFMMNEAARRVGVLDGVTEVVVEHDGGLDWDDDSSRRGPRAPAPET